MMAGNYNIIIIYYNIKDLLQQSISLFIHLVSCPLLYELRFSTKHSHTPSRHGQI